MIWVRRKEEIFFRTGLDEAITLKPLQKIARAMLPGEQATAAKLMDVCSSRTSTWLGWSAATWKSAGSY